MTSRFRNFDFAMKPFGNDIATPNGNETLPQTPGSKKQVRIQEFPHLGPTNEYPQSPIKPLDLVGKLKKIEPPN